MESRTGIKMNEKEFSYLKRTIKNGVDNKESIYHIVKSDPVINVSVAKVYDRLMKKLTNLPYAAKSI